MHRQPVAAAARTCPIPTAAAASPHGLARFQRRALPKLSPCWLTREPTKPGNIFHHSVFGYFFGFVSGLGSDSVEFGELWKILTSTLVGP